MHEDLVLNKLLACNRIIRYCDAVNSLVSSTKESRYRLDPDIRAAFIQRYRELWTSATSDFDLLNLVITLPDFSRPLDRDMSEESLLSFRNYMTTISNRVTYISDELLRSRLCM